MSTVDESFTKPTEITGERLYECYTDFWRPRLTPTHWTDLRTDERNAWNYLADTISEAMKPHAFVMPKDSITPEMIREFQKPGKIVVVSEPEPPRLRKVVIMRNGCGDFIEYDGTEFKKVETVDLPKPSDPSFIRHHRTCGLRRGETCTCGPTT